MVLIHFEVFKPKKTIKLDIPLNTPFSNISELIIDHFELNRKEIPEDIISNLKYLKNGSALEPEKTPESYNITENSKIIIYIPKKISDLISNPSTNENNTPQKETTFSSPDTTPSDEYTNKTTDSTLNENITNDESESETSEVNYTTILHYVGKKNIKELTDYGFDTIDSAYALAYKPNVNSAFHFLTTGMASMPKIRDHINKLVSASFKHDDDEILRQTIEIAKIESQMRNENEFVYIAALICIHTATKPIKSEPFKAELQEFLMQVQMNFPGQTLMKANQIMQCDGMNDVQIKSQIMNQVNVMNQQQQQQMMMMNQMQMQNQMNMMNPMQAQMNILNQQQQMMMMNQMPMQNQMNMMDPMQMQFQMNMMNQQQMMQQQQQMMMNQMPMQNQMNMMNPMQTQMNILNQQQQMMNPMQMQFQMNMMNQQQMINQQMMQQQQMVNQQIMQQQQIIHQQQMLHQQQIANQMNMMNHFSALHDMQFQMMNRMNMFNQMPFLNSEQVKDKFQKIFLDLPVMTPDNYINPFEETFNDVMSIPHNPNIDFYFQFGKTLNYDQLLFMYQMMISKGIQLNLIIECLKESNGDIDKAEELINQNTDN